ncbi:MAG: hypothetical protein RL631_2250 [Pseudomonadota bacterium]
MASLSPVTTQPRAIELRQICYSPQTLSELPEGMLALDYQDNARPDWREYWPIRQFLLNNVLADDTLYGFFSPKFGYKTGLGSADVQAFIHQDSGLHDAYFFSPFWDLSSFFINIFEQGDFFHPGLTQASQKFVDSIGLSTPVKFQVTHSQNTVFCNYIVANKTFWLKWLALGERLFFAAEHPEADPQLQALLRDDTTYGEQRLPLKVFLLERLATLLLLNEPALKAKGYDCFQLSPSITPLNQFFNEAVQCNALKMAYDQSASPFNLHAFMNLRNQVFQQLH